MIYYSLTNKYDNNIIIMAGTCLVLRSYISNILSISKLLFNLRLLVILDLSLSH